MKETKYIVRVVYNDQPQFDNYKDYTFKNCDKAHRFACIATHAEDVFSASLYSHSVEEKLELTIRPKEEDEEDEEDTPNPFVKMEQTYFEMWK